MTTDSKSNNSSLKGPTITSAALEKTRPSKEEMWLAVACVVASRSLCQRLKVGAVITDQEMEYVYSIGYNGMARGGINTCDNDCQIAGACGTVHGELNAVIKCNTRDRLKVMFVTHAPCVNCAKLIVNSGFSKVYFMDYYRDREGIKILNNAWITTEQIR